MRQRIQEIINYKTAGKQNKFAQLMGWSPQYTGRLLKEGSVGLQPLLTILDKIPEISARWLLLGQGSMLEDDNIIRLQKKTFESVQALLELEDLIPYMSAEELREIETSLLERKIPVLSYATRRLLQDKKHAREAEMSLRLAEAIKEASK